MAWFRDVHPSEVFFLDDPFFNPPPFSDLLDFTSSHLLRRRRQSRDSEMQRQVISVLIEEIPFHEFGLHEHMTAITHTFIRFDDEPEEEQMEEEEENENDSHDGAFVFDFATKKWIPDNKQANTNTNNKGTQQDPIEIDMEEETQPLAIIELEDLAFRNLLHLPRSELYRVFEL